MSYFAASFLISRVILYGEASNLRRVLGLSQGLARDRPKYEGATVAARKARGREWNGV
jgi:hypothetical protein